MSAATMQEAEGRFAPLPLSRRQAEVYRYLRGYERAHGRAPALTEIAAVLGLRSKSTVLEHLAALEKKGWIQREPGKMRGIRLLGEVRP